MVAAVAAFEITRKLHKFESGLIESHLFFLIYILFVPLTAAVFSR
jgi:hypothetical protein